MKSGLYVKTLRGIIILIMVLWTCTAAGAEQFTSDELNPLLGRWLRPDGGYILEIRSAEPGGKLEAYYFNPRSINVHRAQAYRNNAYIKLIVELKDAGYPGSTYALFYRPEKDILIGYYYQAGRKQYFEVFFVRPESR